MWQVDPLLNVQSHLIAGLSLESVNRVPSTALPVHGLPVKFHPVDAEMPQCSKMEFRAITVQSIGKKMLRSEKSRD